MIKFYTRNLAPGSIMANVSIDMDVSAGEGLSWRHTVRCNIVRSHVDGTEIVLWPTNQKTGYFLNTPADKSQREIADRHILSAWRKWKERSP